MEVKRIEKKYIINQKEKMLLEKRLSGILERDSHCIDGKGYSIRTLYFDTITDRCCVEKEDGLQIHEKIRIRIYNGNQEIIKLECKRKNGEAQVKKSLLITKDMYCKILKKDYSCLLNMENPMGIYFFEKLSKGMFPKVIVEYDRMSYCFNSNNVRITIDSNIRATECSFDLFNNNLEMRPVLTGNSMILEVKYTGFLFDFIKNALKGIDKMPDSYSKYFCGRKFYRTICG